MKTLLLLIAVALTQVCYSKNSNDIAKFLIR
jgi:hypothetical protein